MTFLLCRIRFRSWYIATDAGQESEERSSHGCLVGHDSRDWRENVKGGINEFLGKMKSHYRANDTWHSWIKRSWMAYNGKGSDAQEIFHRLAASAEGLQVTNTPAPNKASTRRPRLPSPVAVTSMTLSRTAPASAARRHVFPSSRRLQCSDQDPDLNYLTTVTELEPDHTAKHIGEPTMDRRQFLKATAIGALCRDAHPGSRKADVRGKQAQHCSHRRMGPWAGALRRDRGRECRGALRCA